MVKNTPANAGDCGLIPGWGRSPWRKARQPTPVFLPGDSHEQMSLAGYYPQGHKELDTAKVTEYAQLMLTAKREDVKCPLGSMIKEHNT